MSPRTLPVSRPRHGRDNARGLGATPAARRVAAALLGLAIGFGAAPPAALAHNPSGDLSAASALSVAVPVAVSLAGPVLVLAGGSVLTVAAVQVSAEGTVWVLERASDGARISVRWARDGAAASVMAVGSAVAVTAIATGWLLSRAGEVIAFIPNEIGASLTHNERITR
jgi:hypothetical protein